MRPEAFTGIIPLLICSLTYSSYSHTLGLGGGCLIFAVDRDSVTLLLPLSMLYFLLLDPNFFEAKRAPDDPFTRIASSW